MDITPQVLKDVKFTERMRGYDRDEVDEFLERVGAGVALVQNRLREASERAEAAEARAHALGNRSEAEETLKRTLVLAQRTADAAVAEANETAARTVSEAEARAARMLADAEAQAGVLRTEAEAEARRVIETTRAPLVEEIKELEQLRNFLHDDIQLLEGHLASQRERLRAQVADLQRLIDDPGMLEVEPTPETSGVDPSPSLPPADAPVPTPTPTPTHAASPPPVSFVEPPPAAVTGGQPTVWPEYEPPSTSDDRPSNGRPDEPSWGSPTEFSLTPDRELPAFEPAPFEPAPFESAPFEPAPFDNGRFDEGPPTQQVRSLADLEAGGDSFLDQLRRAVDDEPDDDRAMTAFFDQDVDERPRSRFGRRR
jgi:DivIVA domain-containing protein